MSLKYAFAVAHTNDDVGGKGTKQGEKSDALQLLLVLMTLDLWGTGAFKLKCATGVRRLDIAIYR